jgi:hypothetical protein
VHAGLSASNLATTAQMQDAVTEKFTGKEDYRIVHVEDFLAENRSDGRREQVRQFLYVSQFFKIEDAIFNLRYTCPCRKPYLAST